MRTNDNGSSALTVFLSGAALGAVAALLLAPKSGEETREDIKKAMNDIRDNVSDKVSSGSDAAKTKLTDAVNMTKTVATESKRAAREASSRVKEKNQRQRGVSKK